MSLSIKQAIDILEHRDPSPQQLRDIQKLLEELESLYEHIQKWNEEALNRLDAPPWYFNTDDVKTNPHLEALTDKSFSGYADKLNNQTTTNTSTTAQTSHPVATVANQTASQQQGNTGSQTGQDNSENLS